MSDEQDRWPNQRHANGLWTSRHWLMVVWDEVLWFVRTLGVVALSIGIGRLIKWLTRGGVDFEALLKGGWHDEIDRAVRGQGRRDDERGT